jgi:hypothetical protein
MVAGEDHRLARGLQALPEFVRRLVIERRAWIIEDQHAWTVKCGSSHGESGALTAAQTGVETITELYVRLYRLNSKPIQQPLEARSHTIFAPFHIHCAKPAREILFVHDSLGP